MTFLPILERELRLRARSRMTYWARVAVGLLALFIALPAFFWSAPAGMATPPATLGRSVSIGLAGAVFLLCCAACLLTADSISRERREGTLGLLFLTRVNHFDILLGKFASSGLSCLLALVGLLPVFMLPVLAGGVTGGEIVREGLGLLVLLFLALSAGLWASTRKAERLVTARTAVLVVLGIAFIPVVLGPIFRSSDVPLLSPLGAMSEAADRPYRLAPGRYWFSLGLVSFFATALLGGAVVGFRRRGCPSDEDRPGRAPSLPPGGAGASVALAPDAGARSETCSGASDVHPLGEGTQDSTGAPPRLEEMAAGPSPGPADSWRVESVLDPSPIAWRVRRQSRPAAIFWCAAAVGLLHFPFFGVAGLLRFGGIGFYQGVMWSTNLVLAGITGALLAWGASRFLVEARNSGELELLLTTPAGAATLLSSQWQVLKRSLRWPLLVMVAPILLQGLFALGILRLGGPRTSLGGPRTIYFSGSLVWQLYYGCAMVLATLNTVLGAGALCWLGLWFGLRAGGQGSAILWAVGAGRLAPSLFNIAYSMVAQALVRLSGGWDSTRWLVFSIGPGLVTMAYLIVIMYVARRQFSAGLSGQPAPTPRQMLAQAVARFHWFRHWTPG